MVKDSTATAPLRGNLLRLGVMDSNITALDVSLNSLSLRHSTATSVELKQGTDRNSMIYIEDSTLGSLKLYKFSTITISRTTIGLIPSNGLRLHGQFTYSRIKIVDTKLQKVKKHGIILQNYSDMILYNTEIDHIESHAFFVGANCKLKLRNVDIKRSEMFVIFAHVRSTISLTNVTVAGQTLVRNSSFIKYIKTRGDNQLYLHTDNEHCISDSLNLSCDFSDFKNVSTIQLCIISITSDNHTQ